MQNNSTGKRLAKNTFYMYLRMFVQLIISLYTTRVVLKQLGVDDYGIYNLAGSVVALFVSLRVLFASTTQRFLNYEMGKNGEDSPNLKKIFNMSLNVDVIISAIFVLCVELVGIWFFNNKVNVDPSRLTAAKVVFHLSLASSVCSIFMSTFDAEIISHERMDFYAIMSIVTSLLKLLVVFLLSAIHYDKLITYGILLFLVYLCMLVVNLMYCHFSFKECRFAFTTDKKLAKEMLSFAGWSFMGNTAFSLAHEGINMVLNVFGGAVVNAARGIAYQVQGAIFTFLNNISVVVRPYSVKEYAKENYSGFNFVIGLSAKIMFFVQAILVTIIGLNISVVLDLWLGTVPQYAAVFTQIILIDSLVRSFSPSIDTVFKAEGRMKEYQIVEGIILALPLPVAYILMKLGASFEFVFFSICISDIIDVLIVLFVASKYTKIDLTYYFKNVLLPCGVVFIVLSTALIITPLMTAILHRIIVSIVLLIVFLVYFWFIGFNKTEKSSLLSVLKGFRRFK